MTTLNRDAVDFAKNLIEKGDFATNTVWEDVQPNPERESIYLDNHSWDDFARWHLGLDESLPHESRERFIYPIGDLQTVHRSGLVAAGQRAAEQGAKEIENAVDFLIEQIDAT